MISSMKAAVTLRVEADVHQLARIRHFVTETASTLTQNTDAINDLILALTEAVTNVIVHGYQKTSGPLEITVGIESGALVTILSYRAPPFDPTRCPIPDTTLPLEKRPPGGMGVHMIRHLTNEIRYRRTPDGENELTLIKKTEMHDEHNY
jgi:serine/threonine-protein kinase RsbW